MNYHFQTNGQTNTKCRSAFENAESVFGSFLFVKTSPSIITAKLIRKYT